MKDGIGIVIVLLFGVFLFSSTDSTKAMPRNPKPVCVCTELGEHWKEVGIAGDVNGDGVINAGDYNLIVKYLQTKQALDYNRDGIINDQDALELLDYIFSS